MVHKWHRIIKLCVFWFRALAFQYVWGIPILSTESASFLAVLYHVLFEVLVFVVASPLPLPIAALCGDVLALRGRVIGGRVALAALLAIRGHVGCVVVALPLGGPLVAARVVVVAERVAAAAADRAIGQHPVGVAGALALAGPLAALAVECEQ